MGYGSDPLTQEVTDRLRDVFEAPDAAVHLVATGTSANALALATMIAPWQTVFCHRHAHIEEDECGAPEFFTGGAKLVPLDGADGRIDPALLSKRLEMASPAVHQVQKGVLSLTNLTERGTRYSVAQIAELSAIAKAHAVPVHLDGARFANALVAEGCSPAEMTWKAGVDAVSFGGTKNGLLAVEAVILFDPDKARDFEFRRKRGGHLVSKHRFLAAQMAAYLDGDLWLSLATQANAMAERLETGLREAGVQLMHPRGGNMLFVEWPQRVQKTLQKAGAVFYGAPVHGRDPEAANGCMARLVTSWSTTEDQVDRFLAALGHPD
jgi:threonine aldolase